MEFGVGKEFHALGIPFAAKEFNIKKGILVSGIIREDKLIIPDGNSFLKEGDRVLLTVPVAKHIHSLSDVFD